MRPGMVFKNYTPAPAMQALLRRMLTEISNLAPPEAAASFLMEELEDGTFACRAEVRTKSGGFLGRGQDAFDSVAASKAAKHLMDSLVLWKEGRYGPERSA